MSEVRQESLFQRLFVIDFRSLRLFRALLGLIVILDAIQRLPIARQFYSDQGIWPRWVFALPAHSPDSISLFMFSGSVWWAIGLFVLIAALGVLLLWRIEERALSFLLLVLITSVQHRSPYLNYGYDVLLRAMLFWSMLLPASRQAGRFADWLSAGALLQVAMIYCCAGFLKSSEAWLWHPDAVYYALSLDFYVSWAGEVLHAYPRFLRLVTVTVVLLERLGWLMFFIPWHMALWRSLAVLSFVAMHLGFALFMDLGNFPLADIAFVGLFVPSEVWDYCERHLLKLKVPRTLPMVQNSRALQSLAVLFFVLFAWWNLQDFSPTVLPMPRIVNWGYRSFGLDQSWGVFAPYPLSESGWVLAEGRKVSGQRVDALLGSETPIVFTHPQSVAQSLPNRHWIDFLVHLALSNDWGLRAHFADFLCSEWERNKNESLRSVDLYYVRQWIPPPGEPAEYFPLLIFSRRCKGV